MPYTTEAGGRLNNFAAEPKMYQAEASNQKQKVNYLILGILAIFLICSLVFVAFSVSA